MIDQQTYKPKPLIYFSNLRIVSMIPGDRKVARRFNFSEDFGGIF